MGASPTKSSPSKSGKDKHGLMGARKEADRKEVKWATEMIPVSAEDASMADIEMAETQGELSGLSVSFEREEP